MTNVFRFGALTLALAAVLGPMRARAVDTIAFTDGPGGAVAVQLSVDGRTPIPAIVDLGAGMDMLSTSAGGQYVSVRGKYATLRLTSQRSDIPYGSVVSLAIGPVKLNAPMVGIWNGLDGAGYDGVLAATSFATIATTFDFRAHQLIVEDAVTFPDRKRVSSRVPITVRDDAGLALDLFAHFDAGGKPFTCQITTGPEPIAFDKSLAAGLGVNLADPSLPHVKTPWGDGVGATIASLTLEGASQTAMAHPKVVFADLIHDCYVGNAFWSPRGFTIDVLGSALYIPGS